MFKLVILTKQLGNASEPRGTNQKKWFWLCADHQLSVLQIDMVSFLQCLRRLRFILKGWNFFFTLKWKEKRGGGEQRSKTEQMKAEQSTSMIKTFVWNFLYTIFFNLLLVFCGKNFFSQKIFQPF